MNPPEQKRGLLGGLRRLLDLFDKHEREFLVNVIKHTAVLLIVVFVAVLLHFVVLGCKATHINYLITDALTWLELGLFFADGLLFCIGVFRAMLVYLEGFGMNRWASGIALVLLGAAAIYVWHSHRVSEAVQTVPHEGM